MLHKTIAGCLAFAALLAFTGDLLAQCPSVLLPAAGGGGSFDNSVLATTIAANGDLIVGGDFATAPGAAASRVARWDGSSWSALGSGCNGSVAALATMGNGDIIAGGTFSSAGGTAAANIARWDGVAWTALGSGLNGSVMSMLVLPNGDLIVGGDFTTAGGNLARRLARWSAGAWSPMGNGGIPPFYAFDSARQLARMADGTIVAHVFSYVFGTQVVRWNGTDWQSFLTVSGSIASMLATANGDLVLAGSFTSIGTPSGVFSANGIARWNGVSLTALPNLGWPVMSLAELPNGDLLAGHYMAAQRWNGSTWSTVMTMAPGNSSEPRSMLVMPQGQVAIGGTFSSVTGVGSPYFVRLAPTCPTSIVAFGSGCAGSGGLNQLTATSQPWVGSTFRTRATGMPSFGYAAAVYGLAPLSVPLQAVLFGGQPGCVGYATPDFLEVVLPSSGEASFQLPLPNNLALVGAQLHEFVLVQEHDAAWAFVGFTSSNGLTMTLGHL